MMTTPQPEPKIKSSGFPFHWWWVIVLVLLAGFALFGDKGVLRLVKSYNQRTELQVKVEQLMAENQQLKREIDALQKDYSTIERIARQELGMVREDEIVYQFPKQKPPGPPEPAPAK
jgi:cell division protein FtsL